MTGAPWGANAAMLCIKLPLGCKDGFSKCNWVELLSCRDYNVVVK